MSWRVRIDEMLSGTTRSGESPAALWVRQGHSDTTN